MKKIFSRLFIVVSAMLLSGCASSYRPIYPSSVNYTIHEMQEGIGLSYRYNVLSENGNKKYAKREQRNIVKVVSVKITNNTDTTINIGRNVAFFSGQNQLSPMEPIAVKNELKQPAPLYLLYLLFTPLKIYWTRGQTTSTLSVGYILGPVLAIGNMAHAARANADFQSELYQFNVLNRDIQKGETLYGIISLNESGYGPLSIRFINK